MNNKQTAIHWMISYYRDGGPLCERCPGNKFDYNQQEGYCTHAEHNNVIDCLALIPPELLTDEQITKRIMRYR